MEENKYFQEALSDFAAEFAYAGAVRHLCDLGYSVEEIKAKIAYPVSLEKIEKVVEEYKKAKSTHDSEYVFIQQTDSLGRRSFLKVKKENAEL